MQIQTTNTNFRGGFFFPNMPKRARKNLNTVVNRGKQIFDNFEKEGDVFLVVRDEYDKRIAKFIQETATKYKNGVKFEYYPKINTKCHLDCEIPETLSILLRNMVPENNLLLNLLQTKPVKEPLHKSKNDYIKNIINAINIRFDNPKIKHRKGLTVVDSNTSNYSISISPIFDGVHYVEVSPKISMSDMSSKRYAIKPNGEKTEFDQSLSSIMLFNELRKCSLKSK